MLGKDLGNKIGFGTTVSINNDCSENVIRCLVIMQADLSEKLRATFHVSDAKTIFLYGFRTQVNLQVDGRAVFSIVLHCSRKILR